MAIIKKSIAVNWAMVAVLIIGLGPAACGRDAQRAKGVYMLVDTSGTYTLELLMAPPKFPFLRHRQRLKDSQSQATGIFPVRILVYF